MDYEVDLFNVNPDKFNTILLKTDPLYEEYVEDAKKRGVWKIIQRAMKGEIREGNLKMDKFVNMFEVCACYGLNYIGCPITVEGYNLGVFCNTFFRYIIIQQHNLYFLYCFGKSNKKASRTNENIFSQYFTFDEKNQIDNEVCCMKGEVSL